MGLLKIIALSITTVCLIQNKSCEQKDSSCICCKLTFDDSINKNILKETDYNLIDDELISQLVIVNYSKKKLIFEMVEPTIIFCNNNKQKIAKPNLITNSSFPANCDYFYPTDFSGKIIMFNDTIPLYKNPIKK
jgi:hypothetical protein